MRAGDVIGGRYELALLLGRGGMGEVWAGRDRVLRREVAVKLLHTGGGVSPELPARFERVEELGAHRLGSAMVRPIELIAWASDASFYRMIPKAVVQARSLEEIRALFAFSQQTRIPMTFRAAGTSLSGQAISDGLLVEVARNWRELRVEQGGRQIRLQPGVLGARANQALAAYGAKIGPDPGRLPLAPSAAFCPTTPAACAAASSRTPTTPSSR